MPDTSVLQQGGYYLRGGKWPVVLAAARRHRLRLCVPEVVVQEFTAHYEEELDKALKAIERARADLRRQGAEALAGAEANPSALEDHLEHHDAWLRRTIDECGEILPIPDVSHRDLVERILRRRKPFSKGEKGYRDALIWHTAVSAAKQGPMYLLVSDTRDFLDEKKSQLAPDLLQDLDRANVERGNVRLLLSLDDLLRDVLPEDEEAKKLGKATLQGERGLAPFQALTDDFFERERRIPLGQRAALPAWLWDQDIEQLDVERVTISSAHPLDDDRVLLTGEVHGRAYVGGIVWVREFMDDEWQVWDTLGGDQFYVVYPQQQPVHLNFSVSFRPPDELSDLHLERAQLSTDRLVPRPRYTWRPPPDGPEPSPQVEWLQSELSRLIELDSANFRWATHDESLIEDLTNALIEIEPAVSKALTAVESIPLAPDNLSTILEEPAGIRAALKSLRTLRERLNERG